ncbi:hypothetical protein AMJ51_00995 [Microgenomates bacterium DG_75]|nr:MAG: hypothetical protein AMJ51_00995 [Microgenomates bacterium DG_75]
MGGSSRQQLIKAVVKSIVPEGKHGPYAVVEAEGIEGSITFSLATEVWREEEKPKPGDTVLLSKFRETKAGWRAMRGRFFQPFDEQIARSKEHIMKRIDAIIERWKSKFFPSETDKIWREWVDFKERETHDLLGLIRDETMRLEFKARALFILLTPDFSLSPFLWRVRERDKRSYVWLSIKDLEGLSTELQLYVAELIAEFYQYQRREKNVWDTSSEYGHLGLRLLTLLPDEKIEILAPLFESLAWRALSTDTYMWQWIMENSEVDEKWKVILDQEMRQVVTKSLLGTSQLPPLFEDALRFYARVVTDVYRREVYSKALLADQATFIVEVAPRNREGFSLFDHSHVVNIFKVLADEKPECLYNFCSFVMQDGTKGFVVENEASLQAAKLMLEVVGDDPELTQQLQDTILAGKQEIAEKARRGEEYKKRQETRKKAEQAILAKMKQSVS